MPKSRKDKRAFTLVEMMVVLAVMGILVAAVTPSLMTASRQSKASQCSTNLRMIQSAKASYLMSHLGQISVGNADMPDFNSYFPSGTTPERCPCSEDESSGAYSNIADLYADVSCPFNCPSGRNRGDYPYEPDIGGPDYYKNGYHDLRRLKK